MSYPNLWGYPWDTTHKILQVLRWWRLLRAVFPQTRPAVWKSLMRPMGAGSRYWNPRGAHLQACGHVSSQLRRHQKNMKDTKMYDYVYVCILYIYIYIYCEQFNPCSGLSLLIEIPVVLVMLGNVTAWHSETDLFPHAWSWAKVIGGACILVSYPTCSACWVTVWSSSLSHPPCLRRLRTVGTRVGTLN